MIPFVQKRLELKIILALTLVISFAVGLYTYVDTLHVRSDMIRTSERTLGAFAAAISGSVSASMKKGQHEVVGTILEETRTPDFIERLMIYDQSGRPRYGRETTYGLASPDLSISPNILNEVRKSELSIIQEQGGQQFISYYAPLFNGPECHRCHGAQGRLNGILRIDFSLYELNDLVKARRNRVLLWSGGLILLLVGVLAMLLRGIVYRPLRGLRDAMAGATDGTAVKELDTSGHDELADLKRSFVGMLARIEALHHANVEQEVRLVRAQDTARFKSELQAMFDAMPDGVLMVDPGLRIVQSNRRVHELLPALQEAPGSVLTTGRPDESGIRDRLQTSFRDERTGEHQSSVLLPDGQRRHLQITCAPIREDGRVIFSVAVIRDMTERIRTERELDERTDELKRTNRLLAHLAVTDSLTLLYNRRHLDEILYKEIKRYNRRKYTSLSLMMIDIDHFKALNDRCGHLAGDTVLREIAAVLKQEVRETDTIARYGGEEFVVVMPDTHIDGAGHKAEMLRKKVQSMEFPGHDEPIKITISIGVAEYVAGFSHDLVQAADKALYRAKQGGRNVVVVHRREEANADVL